MALDYRNVPVPARTVAEDDRRRFGWHVASWAAAFSVFLFAIVIPVGSYRPRHAAGAESGLVALALLLVFVFLAAAVWNLGREWVGVQAVSSVERRWSDLLHRCGLFPATGRPPVRLLRGDASLNEVAFQVPHGTKPEAIEGQASAMALAWHVAAVKLRRRPGGWVTAELLPDKPEIPVAPRKAIERDAYRLPVARTWRDYLRALPVGVLHNHTDRKYYTADMSWFVGGSAEGVDPSLMLPRDWALPLSGGHLLIAGESGAGKSGVVQAIVSALRPAIAHGVVVAVGIDPKGMELAFGKGYYRHYSSDADGINALLKMLVGMMNERKAAVAGKSRDVPPSKEFPTYVIFVDEAAAIAALDEDSKRAKTTMQYLNLILTQGRALGFIVVGAVQDPTKETLKNRDLFTYKWALKLTSAMALLVLGPGYKEEGDGSCLPHRIDKSKWQGAGWISDPDGFAFVRSHFVTDDELIADRAEWDDGEYLGDLAKYPAPPDDGGPEPDPGPGGGGGLDGQEDDDGAANAWSADSPGTEAASRAAHRARQLLEARRERRRPAGQSPGQAEEYDRVTQELGHVAAAAAFAAWQDRQEAKAGAPAPAAPPPGPAAPAPAAPEPEAVPDPGPPGDELPPVYGEAYDFVYRDVGPPDAFTRRAADMAARERAEAGNMVWLGSYSAESTTPDGHVPASLMQPFDERRATYDDGEGVA